MLPDRTKRVVFDMLVGGAVAWKQRCQTFFDEALGQRDGLQPKEGELRTKTPAKVQGVNVTTRILFMQVLLRRIDYPDQDVARLRFTGSPLVGTLDSVGVFEERAPGDVVPVADPIWLARCAR